LLNISTDITTSKTDCLHADRCYRDQSVSMFPLFNKLIHTETIALHHFDVKFCDICISQTIL